MSDVLRSDATETLRHFACLIADDWHVRALGSLDETVRTGEQATNQIYGMPVFAYFEKDRKSAENFNRAMTSFSTVEAPAIAKAYDFSRNPFTNRHRRRAWSSRSTNALNAMKLTPGAKTRDRLYRRRRLDRRRAHDRSWHSGSSAAWTSPVMDGEVLPKAGQVMQRWFTEGFETRDLKDAKALLQELAA